MPIVTLTDTQRAEQYKKKVKAQILLQLSETKVTKKDLADALGMSKQTFGYRFKTMNFDVGMMWLIKKKLNMEDL